MKYEQNEYFKLAISDIFRVRNEFFLVFCRNRVRDGIFSMFLSFRAGWKSNERNPLKKSSESEERKVKNIGKKLYLLIKPDYFI